MSCSSLFLCFGYLCLSSYRVAGMVVVLLLWCCCGTGVKGFGRWEVSLSVGSDVSLLVGSNVSLTVYCPRGSSS